MLKALYMQTFHRRHCTEILRNNALVKGEKLLSKYLLHPVIIQCAKIQYGKILSN